MLITTPRLHPGHVGRSVRDTPVRPMPAGRAPVPQGITRAGDSWWYRLRTRVIYFLTHLDFRPAQAPMLGLEVAAALDPKLTPGTILLRRTDWTSSNLFTPGFWKHAAVYVGDGRVVDAMGTGVRDVPLASFLGESHYVVAVRPKGMSADQARQAADYARAQVGKAYDFAFDFGSDARLACTELATRATNRAMGRALVNGNAAGHVFAGAFLGDGMEVVWTNAPAHAPAGAAPQQG